MVRFKKIAAKSKLSDDGKLARRQVDFISVGPARKRLDVVEAALNGATQKTFFVRPFIGCVVSMSPDSPGLHGSLRRSTCDQLGLSATTSIIYTSRKGGGGEKCSASQPSPALSC